MPSNTYMTLQDADDYFERIIRFPDETHEVYDKKELMEIMAAATEGRAIFVKGTFGYVIEVMPLGLRGPRGSRGYNVGCKVTVRPTFHHTPKGRQNTESSKQIEDALHDNWEAIKEESDMSKVYEAVIVRQDPTTSELIEVVAVVGPFVAANDSAAQKQVLIDHCQQKGIYGKDAANLQVRLRTFSEPDVRF